MPYKFDVDSRAKVLNNTDPRFRASRRRHDGPDPYLIRSYQRQPVLAAPLRNVYPNRDRFRIRVRNDGIRVGRFDWLSVCGQGALLDFNTIPRQQTPSLRTRSAI